MTTEKNPINVKYIKERGCSKIQMNLSTRDQRK